MATKGQYFLKDKKARIYRKCEGGTEPRGSTYYVPLTASDVWCYTRQLTENQLFTAHMYLDDETRFFVFNFQDGIKQYDVIRYKEAWYSITRVDTMDDYNGELFVYVKNIKINPKQEQVKPYGFEP